MRSFYFVLLVILIVYGCTKEDDENITTFKGIALNYSNKKPISAGIITITGIDHGALYVHNVIGQRSRSTATINTDGTFNFKVSTPKNEDYLILTVDIRGRRTTTVCVPTNCLELKPGKAYNNLNLYIKSNIN